MKRLLPIMSAAAAMLAVAACSQDGGTQTGADTTNPPLEQESTGAINDDAVAPADDVQIKPAPDAELQPTDPSATPQ